MVMSEQLSSSTSCMLFTLLLWLPVLTEVLGMEWLLPRLFILQLAASLSCKANVQTHSLRRAAANEPSRVTHLCRDQTLILAGLPNLYH